MSHGVTNRALAGIVRGLSSSEAYALPSPPNDEALVVEWKGKVPAAVESRRY